MESGSLGFSVRKEGWGFIALTVGADPLPLPGTLRASWNLELLPWCKERNHFSYNWGNLFGVEKFVLRRHTGKLSLSPCSLLPASSCAVPGMGCCLT